MPARSPLSRLILGALDALGGLFRRPTGPTPTGDPLDAVNAARARYGKAPLAPLPPLDAIARGWARAMAAAGDVSHDGFDGRSRDSGDLIRGECVAAGPGTTAAEAVAFWLASPGHVPIVLGPYNVGALASATGADGRVYWCLDVGKV